MFGSIVMNIEHHKFEQAISKIKKEKNVKNDTELKVEDLKELVKVYFELVKKETGVEFPRDTKVQLVMAIEAVFSSWNAPRAVSYRRINEITGLLGTAVNV